jgi:ATP-binding cassette subfamily B protein
MEDPAVLNVVGDAREAIDRDYETPGGAVAGALALIARYGTLAGAVVALFVVMPPVAALAVGVAALVVRFGQRGSLGRFGDVWDGLAGLRRRANYLRELSSGPAIAKEARILGITRWLIGRYRKASQAYLTSLWAGRRRILLRPFLGFAMVALIGATIGGLTLVRGTVTGSISALELAVGLQALLIAARFGVFFPESDVRTQYGLQAYQALTTFERRALQAASPLAGRSVEGGLWVDRGSIEQRTGQLIPDPVQLFSAIRFVDVSFRYRENSPLVLDELNLEVPAGKTTAIVGLNGSGKTTIVKLLTRLRAPDSGRIVWDDEDCHEVDLVAWQRRFAVLSQDYGRFEMTVAENVAMGAPEHVADEDGILVSIERTGIGDYIRRLPNGLETLVARQYANGIDLSGGQWQRLALARVLFAVEHGASILVLDEPTAHLDIRAEAEFFDRFLALADGVTNILISHRFATVRRADQILVLHDGRISERGNHSELMEHEGLYAELFHLQARRRYCSWLVWSFRSPRRRFCWSHSHRG